MTKLSLLELFDENKSRYLDTDKEYPNHKYISKFYSNLFSQYNHKPIKLLEIGVGSGGSLILWHDYFKLGKIVGMDNGADPRFPNCVENVKPYRDIDLIEGDAYNIDLVKLLPEFDIIIDDGPHTKDSHLKCLELYLPKLKQGGVLVIEDIMDIGYISEYESKVPAGFICETIDTDRSVEYNNLLFIVKKL